MPFSFIKSFASKSLAKQGRRITRDPISHYLSSFKIDCVFDVGANKGQFATGIRQGGYTGRIESFEPLSDALSVLRTASAQDGNWNVNPFAMGNQACSQEINISANQHSSSFLDFDDAMDNTHIETDYVGTETVKIETLDNVYEDIRANAERVYLKIDTQGFERSVIEGGHKSLEHINLVQMELSLIANYKGESLIEEMISIMRSQNFSPWWILDGFRNSKTLQLYQADVFFVRDGFEPC